MCNVEQLLCNVDILSKLFLIMIGYDLMQGRATFSERGPDETFRSSSWAGGTNENTKMMMYKIITILLLQSSQISEKAGAACHEEAGAFCHEEVCQCPPRWMSSTTE